VLLKYHWKINPEFVETGEADAIVQIGDRTFLNRNQFTYHYDLALEWHKFTGLPFVFAVWASNKIISDDFKTAFNAALEYGLNHRMEMIAELEKVNNIDLENYLMKKIEFDLEEFKEDVINKVERIIDNFDIEDEVELEMSGREIQVTFDTSNLKDEIRDSISELIDLTELHKLVTSDEYMN
jgi:chorismate dehydratase